MRCAFPVFLGGGYGRPREVGCGQCMPCRVNRRRAKAARILLEWMVSPLGGAFLTLTYDEEAVPRELGLDGCPVRVLSRADLRDFLKRFRHHFNSQVRFAGVGEYGSRTQRPHYHLVVMGDPLEIEDAACQAWQAGFVDARELTVERALYCAHYTTKKMTQAHDERLVGRPPEFYVGNRRPALGCTAIPFLAEYYETEAGSRVLAERGDIERTFRFQGRMWPLDYHVQRELRRCLGIPELERDRDGPRKVRDSQTTAENRRLVQAHEKMLAQQVSHGVL